MSVSPRPPRLAVWLASAMLPALERESILGDLEEAFARRSARSPSAAAAWYWSQVGLFFVSATMEVGTMTMRLELLQAARRLGRDWRFSASIVAVLGIGVGAALVAWSVVDGVLLSPLPYERTDRLALIRVDLGEIRSHPGLAMAEVADLRTLEPFAGVESATAETVLTLETDGRMDPVLTSRVSPGLFPLLGVAPALGRGFEEADAETRFGGAIVSHGFWRTRLGGDAGVLERRLRIDGNEVPVVGVMPERFALHLGAGSNVSAGVEVWLPLRIDPSHRAFWGYRSVARLADGASFQNTNAALESVAERLRQEWPEAYGDGRLGFVAHPLHEDLLRDTRPAIDTAVAGVLLLLLVSLANGAALMLGRQRAREANLAVRSALGAGRSRLVGVVLGESLVLAIASGIVGATVAAWGVGALRAVDPPGVPRWDELALDGRFFLAALALALLGTIATGLYPATKVSTDSARTLRGETLQRGSSATAMRRSLVGMQMAIAVVLVFAALVLGRSALRLARVDLGFDPANVLTLAVPTDGDVYEELEDEWAFHRQLRERLEALPGVLGAGAVSHLPLSGYAPTDAYAAPSADTLNWGSHLANYFAALPGYLETIGVELRQGRMLDDDDLAAARPVVVVDETLTERLFPGESPLGKVIRAGWGIPDVEIVGVIRHPRVMDVRAGVRPQIYVPYTVFSWGPLHWTIRTEGDPESIAPAVRREIDELGAGRAVFGVRPLDSYLDAATSSVRMTLTLIVAQAALTGLLAALGSSP